MHIFHVTDMPDSLTAARHTSYVYHISVVTHLRQLLGHVAPVSNLTGEDLLNHVGCDLCTCIL